MRAVLAPALAGVWLAGCAAFQAAPTASTCRSSQGELAAAEAGLLLAQTALTSAGAAGAGGPTITDLQNAVNAYQAQIAALQSLADANCAAPAPQVALSTPFVSASVKLGS